MDTLFTTCLLVQGETQTTELIQAHINLHPGSRFSSDQENTVLLAGGFPTLSPESEFPLSSTLFVNSSLADHAPDTLRQIAMAELQRKNSVDFRSYTIEPDYRVAVIGDDVDTLLAFMNNYGGVLQIEPLLIKGCHPELPTVSELSVTPKRNSCRLEYQVRSPISLHLCSYCGACGPACPEGCIDERLFLDYNKCTLCRECEQVCPTKAIDIHTVQIHTVEVPAIIVLGDVQLEDAGPLVYRESDLSRYFATLFPARIEELVTWNRSLCQYSSRLGSGCDLCRTACRFGAITQNSEGVLVDPLTCEECGACVGVCPTGAMEHATLTDANFHQYLETFPSLSGATVVLGTESSLHRLWWLSQAKNYQNTLFIAVAKTQALSLYHFLAIATRGATRLIVLDSEPPENFQQLDLTNIFLQKFFDNAQFGCCMSPDSLAKHGITAESSAALEIPMVSDGVQFRNRRQAVAASLEHLVHTSGRSVELRAQGKLPFGTISCDNDRCTLCGACLNDCRIQALSADSEALQLNHTGAFCVACGVCVKTCPEKALSLSPTFTLTTPYFAPATLAQAEPMACKKCGKIFGTKKSYERVMAILAAKESVDTSHFEYCDECRVIKIFEEQ